MRGDLLYAEAYLVHSHTTVNIPPYRLRDEQIGARDDRADGDMAARVKVGGRADLTYLRAIRVLQAL